jgi:predicted ester cyclase
MGRVTRHLAIIFGTAGMACVAPLAADKELPELKIVDIPSCKTMESLSPEILAARRFVAFWNTGDRDYIDQALDPGFVDRTLPVGREQGPAGLISAAENIRKAIPDLHIDLEKLIISDQYVILHMDIKGRFTGVFKYVKGEGQEINYGATNIFKIKDGKITDNWHVEELLKLYQQLGLVK